MAKGQSKFTCMMMVLLIAVVTLLVLALAFFAISSLFELGVWEEFWDMVAQKTGKKL